MIRKKDAIRPYQVLFFMPWIIYFTHVWLQAIQVTGSGWYAAYLPHWADGAAHLSYMAAFAFRHQFPIMHPVFYGHPFTYSFLSDAIGGWLTKAGLSLWSAYNLWGLVLTIATLIAIWAFLKTFLQTDKRTFVAGNLFLLSGGLGWKYIMLDKLGITTPPESPFFPLLYTQREGTDIVWLNVIVGELLPQRAFLLAIPLAIFLLITWYQLFIKKQAVSTKRVICTGLIFGCMPIIHPHTTMMLALTIIWWALPQLIKNWKQTLKPLLLIGIPTIIIGGLNTVRFLSPSVSSGFFSYLPGWLASVKETNWFIFWMDNWGLFLPLAAVGTYLIKSSTTRSVIMPFWVWFGLANLFLFQPYDWDNSKLFTWVYLVFTIPVTLALSRLWRGQLLNRLLVIISIACLTLAGAIDVGHLADTKTYKIQLLSPEEIELGTYVRSHTPDTSIILASTTHRNWVPIMTGRQILCGYQGWMWTYGIKAGQRVTDVREMFAGTTNALVLLKSYGINYVVIGPEERAEFSVNDEFYAKYPILIKTPTTTVYQITP
jgi:hypothetical protein